MAYCLKNIKKCQFCKIPCDINEYEKHLIDNQGNHSLIKKYIDESDIHNLKQIQDHLSSEISINEQFMKDSEDPLNNSIIHYIIEKAADREYSITKTMFDQVCIDLDFNT